MKINYACDPLNNPDKLSIFMDSVFDEISAEYRTASYLMQSFLIKTSEGQEILTKWLNDRYNLHVTFWHFEVEQDGEVLPFAYGIDVAETPDLTKILLER